MRGISPYPITPRDHESTQESTTTPENKQQPVTLEGHGLIRGERAKTYGPPHDNFERIADLWSSYLGGRIETELARDPSRQIPRYGFLTGTDVCNLMILMKVAREGTGMGYHRDSTVDVVGYAALKEILNEIPRDEFVKEIE